MAASGDIASAKARSNWQLQFAAFWRWWVQELAQLVPERLSTMSGVAAIPVVALEGEDVVLVEARPGAAARPASRVAMGGLGGDAQRAALRQLLESAGETRGRVRLRLARDEALVRRVSLPAATEENLHQVLGFEMDRFTPFRLDDVYFDHRVMSRDSVSGQIAVEIAVARRELVDARVDQLRAWGASVQGVTVEGEAERGAAPLDLLPSEQRGQRESGGERWLVPGLAVLALALLVVALLYPAYNKRSAAVALIPQVAKAKQEAEAADVIARQLERQVADYNFMVTRKQTTWPVLAYIEEVTRLLPDNTWVQQLDVKTNGRTREVQVTGETASSSKLIEVLEQSSILQNAAPKGTVTRGSQPGAERFVIAAESRPRQAPPPRPLLEVAEVLPAAPAPPAPGTAPIPTPTPPAAASPPTATLEVAPRGGPPPPARGGRDVPPERAPAQPGR